MHISPLADHINLLFAEKDPLDICFLDYPRGHISDDANTSHILPFVRITKSKIIPA